MHESTGLRVLIADDSAALRQRLNTMISPLDGIDSVVEVDNGTDAIELIRSIHPDVAVLDIRMPGRSGIDVLLESREVRPAPVVIMLTNYPYPAYRARCLESGASHFFDKNTEFMNVIDVLNDLVRARQEPQKPGIQPSSSS